DQVLAAITPREAEVAGAHFLAVGQPGDQAGVLVIGMRHDIKHAAHHLELLHPVQDLGRVGLCRGALGGGGWKEGPGGEGEGDGRKTCGPGTAMLHAPKVIGGEDRRAGRDLSQAGQWRPVPGKWGILTNALRLGSRTLRSGQGGDSSKAAVGSYYCTAYITCPTFCPRLVVVV